MFNIAIIGVNDTITYEYFKERCIYFLKNRAAEGITIYATEENEYIVRFATEFRLSIQYFYTDWKAFGKKAIRERNKLLLATCNGIIWFDDGLKNTKMLKDMAESIGTPVRRGLK